MNCWGFEFAGELVWEKLTVNGKRHFGMGRSGLRYSHEVCMLGKRGKPEPLVRNIRSILSAPMPLDADGKRVHSAKPDEFFELVETHSKGPYCELFARKTRVGWTQIGDQVGKRG
jgi:N6-adenosine-specific RNA methylase IME4